MKTSSAVAGLGAGIALGTLLGFFVLAPNVEGGPGGESTQVQRSLDSERQAKDKAEAKAAAADAVNRSLAGPAVKDLLRDQPVLILATDDADDRAVSATRHLFDESGAVNAGDITLTEKFTSADNGDELKSIAANSLPAGASLSENNLAPGTHIGELLGSALTTGSDGKPPASDSERAVVLGALENGGFVDYRDGTVRTAAAVVIVTGDASGDPAHGNYGTTVVADLATAMDSRTRGVVLAGGLGAAEKDGAVGIVRGRRAAADAVSTVDDIDTTAGRITAVRAVKEQLDGHAGAYGAAANAGSATVGGA
ncbi:copper transporter [Corynebacterium bovis]|uniref:copper transporter n=1 Tax=Corynebacterium bovis TaxID=36808 RepID=UPI00313A26DA